MAAATDFQNTARALLAEGPFERPAWSHFLEWLRKEIGADYVGIHLRLPERPRHSLYHSYVSKQPSPKLEASLSSVMETPIPLPGFSMEHGHVYALSEILDVSRPDHQSFWEDFLRPNGFFNTLMMRFAEPSGVSAWISVSRASRDFDRMAKLMVSSLVTELSRSLRVLVALEHERFKAQVSARAMHRLNFGWLSLGAQGKVIEASGQADELLAMHDALRVTGTGRLVIGDRDANQKLQTCLRAFAGNRAAPPQTLRIAREPWLDLLLVPVAERFSGAATQPIAIAYFHGDDRPTAGRHEQIASLFGLLPSEARLALALSRGLSLAEAAQDLGIAETTARSYSKRIYAKVGARGQVDLVRFVLTSVLSLA